MRTQVTGHQSEPELPVSARLVSVLVLVLALGAAACSSSPAGSGTPGHDAGSSGTSGSPDASLTPATNTATLDGLGTIRVTLDTASQDAETYDATSGAGAHLHVRDTNGYTWNLSIPAGALPETTTLTMTPFIAIDLTKSQSGIMSGVRLEPDGLYFSHEAYLSVSPPDGIDPGKSLVFSLTQGAADSSAYDVGLAVSAHLGLTSTSNVWHFSGLAYGDGYTDPAIATLLRQAEQDYQNALAAAKTFVKGPVPTPPTPPAISMYCRGTEVNPEQGEAYGYVHAFLSPFDDVANPLLVAMRNIRLLGGDDDLSQGATLALQIAQMALTSIVSLGDSYAREDPPDHLFAVIAAALTADRAFELLGGSDTTTPPKVSGWAGYLRDYYLGQLKDQHDYRAFPILLTLEKSAELLGNTNQLAAIFAAMTFEVKATTNLSSTSTSTTDGSTLYTGTVQQSADAKNITNEDYSDTWGVVHGQNLVLTSTAGSYTDNQSHTTALAGQVDTGSVWMQNWDACVTKSFDVLVSFYGTNNESAWINYDATQLGLKSYYWDGAAGFMFTVPMTNRSATFGDQTFSGSGSNPTQASTTTASASVEIQIIHTPQ